MATRSRSHDQMCRPIIEAIRKQRHKLGSDSKPPWARLPDWWERNLSVYFDKLATCKLCGFAADDWGYVNACANGTWAWLDENAGKGIENCWGIWNRSFRQKFPSQINPKFKNLFKTVVLTIPGECSFIKYRFSLDSCFNLYLLFHWQSWAALTLIHSLILICTTVSGADDCLCSVSFRIFRSWMKGGYNIVKWFTNWNWAINRNCGIVIIICVHSSSPTEPFESNNFCLILKTCELWAYSRVRFDSKSRIHFFQWNLGLYRIQWGAGLDDNKRSSSSDDKAFN